MAEIPGWAYLIIGAIVSGFSRFVEVRSGQKMLLFFIIGLVFMVIGVGKIVYGSMFRKKTVMRHPGQTQQRQTVNHQAQRPQIHAPSRMQQTQHTQQFHHTHPYGQNRQAPTDQPFPRQNAQNDAFQSAAHHLEKVPENKSPSASQHPSVITCPACGVRHYDYANFCMICGRQMRRS